MLSILVSGGFDDDASAEDGAPVREFVAHLGDQVIRQGHVLLTGCRTSLDCAVAESAFAAVTALKVPDDRIRSYVCAGEKAAHGFGSVLCSPIGNSATLGCEFPSRSTVPTWSSWWEASAARIALRTGHGSRASRSCPSPVSAEPQRRSTRKRSPRIRAGSRPP